MALSPGQERDEEQVETTVASTLKRLLAQVSGISTLIAIVGVVAVAIGVVVLIVSADLESWALAILALGGILLLIALITSLGTVGQAVTGKRGRYGLSTALMILAFAAIIVLIDVIAYRNPERFDVTATRQFSLADRTVALLRNLPEPVEAIAFFTPNDPAQEQLRQPAQDLLDEFERRSDNFFYRFVDPDRDPNTARVFGVSQYPTIAFVGTESSRLFHLLAPRFQERDFVTALLIVTGEQQKNIYVITGHGERDVTSTEATGFTFAIDGIRGDNYTLQTLSLRERDEIPTVENAERLELTPEDAAAAIIIAGPTQELEEKEFEALFTYLKNGGRAVFLLDPDPPESFKELLGRWGVVVNDGVIIDESGVVSGQPQTPLIPRQRYIDAIPSITSTLDEVFLPGATSFDFRGLYDLPGFRTSFDPETDLAPPPELISYAPLASTTLLSCTTQDPEAQNCSGSPTFGGNLLPGMAIIARAPFEEEPDPDVSEETRIVVLGDSDFVTNNYFYSGSNSDLFLNSVNWLTEDVDLSQVRPKPVAFRLLVLTEPEMRFIQYSSWLLLPIAILLLGSVAWWRRR